MSTSHTHPPAITTDRFCKAASAMCAERLRRNPYEQSKKSCSYTASSTIATARCRTLSSNVGMPSGLVSVPLPFGMWTRRTGGARYVPDFARSSSDRRFSSKFAWYSCALTPSTPRAPPLRVRRYASRSQSMSMRWARLRNAMSGASLASFATRSSFVETSTEDCGSAIFPSNGSMTRCRPLLGGVPRVGSPASSLLLRHSDFPTPIGSRFVAFTLHLPRAFIHTREETPGPPRFLGNPCARAPLFDPGRAAAPDLSGRATLLAQRCCRRFCTQRRPPRHRGFRGSITRLHAPAVYASRPRLPVCCLTAAQDSLPTGRSPLPVGTLTRGLLREVSVIFYMASSSPRLRLAHVQRPGRKWPDASRKGSTLSSSAQTSPPNPPLPGRIAFQPEDMWTRERGARSRRPLFLGPLPPRPRP